MKIWEGDFMRCEYCGRIKGHDCRCPNYIQSKSNHCCSICGECVLPGEEYITNENGNYAHWECVDYARDLAEFLGYEIKEMDAENIE